MTHAGPEGKHCPCPLASAEFQALVPRDACEEGPDGIRRRTCVFTGWPDYEEEPSDGAHDDGVVETGILNPQREPTPLPGWAKALELLPFEERSARDTPNIGAT